jgi:hypothetical protein
MINLLYPFGLGLIDNTPSAIVPGFFDIIIAISPSKAATWYLAHSGFGLLATHGALPYLFGF